MRKWQRGIKFAFLCGHLENPLQCFDRVRKAVSCPTPAMSAVFVDTTVYGSTVLIPPNKEIQGTASVGLCIQLSST